MMKLPPRDTEGGRDKIKREIKIFAKYTPEQRLQAGSNMTSSCAEIIFYALGAYDRSINYKKVMSVIYERNEIAEANG